MTIAPMRYRCWNEPMHAIEAIGPKGRGRQRGAAAQDTKEKGHQNK